MINYFIRRIENPWLRWGLFLLSILIFLYLFGVTSFRPDRAMQKCHGINIPKEVLLVQTESYCRCMKQTVDIKDEDKRSEFCIRSIQANKELMSLTQ